MPLLTPDPTFYPSPRMAMQARQERLGYVVLINPTGKDRPDAMGVIDLDPASSGYGRLVGQTDMPNPGDELHHFGWNACSCARMRRILTWSGDTSSLEASTPLASTCWTPSPIPGSRRS